MNFLLEENKTLLEELIHEDVEFILIGGYAVNFHGYNRTTGDMDLWLRPDNTNKEKFVKALINLGFDEEGILPLTHSDFTDYLVFSIGDPPYKVDFLTHISGVKFDEAWRDKVFLPLRNLQIPVLHLNHLVLSKISNSRPQDKADVEQLQKIAGSKTGR